MTNCSTVYWGTFNAEKYWRNSDLAVLPAIKDLQTENIIFTLDEMLFLCTCGNQADVVATHYPLQSIFIDYLQNLSYKCTFKHLQNSIIKPDNMIANPTFFSSPDFENHILSPYAVLPVMDNINSPLKLPLSSIVSKVNSKKFSTILAQKLGYNQDVTIVSSLDDLTVCAYNLLNQSKCFLIKDEMGVAGSGNVLIKSVQQFKVIARHLSKQEKLGLKISFILEPYLCKATDFSCQLHIDPSGNVTTRTIRTMQNNNFAFYAITATENNLIEKLESNNYFNFAETIGKELASEGYHGDVCIDSMLLANGELRPLVEINARKSIGLFNYFLDCFISNQYGNLQTTIYYYSFLTSSNLTADIFFKLLDQSGILFKKNRIRGIMPLTINSLFINQSLNQHEYKAGLYFAVIDNFPIENINVFFENNGFKILNGKRM